MSDDEEQMEEDVENEEALEEDEEQTAPASLDKTTISECISMISQIGPGLCYSFIKLDCSDRNLTDVDILSQYIHLRFIDISKNAVSTIQSLSGMTNLLLLNASENRLESAAMDALPFLQILNLSKNRIRSLDGINHPKLEYLNISGNLIAETCGLRGPLLDNKYLLSLHTLDLQGNRLTSTAGFDIPTLQCLYLASNNITKIEGLDNLPSLRILHLRNNALEKLAGFSSNLISLEYVNLRGNGVVKARETRNLQCLPALKVLVLSESPAAEEEDYRMEVLAFLRKLVRLDKDVYEEEERIEAEAVLQQKLIEEKEELEAAALLKEQEDLAALEAKNAAEAEEANEPEGVDEQDKPEEAEELDQPEPDDEGQASQEEGGEEEDED